METKNTGMEAKVVCLLGPDLLEAPGFGEFLDLECWVWAKQNKSLSGLTQNQIKMQEHTAHVI